MHSYPFFPIFWRIFHFEAPEEHEAGELTIPIDLLTDDAPPAPPPQPDFVPPEVKPGEGMDAGIIRDASADSSTDAAAAHDAAPPPRPKRDAGIPLTAASDAGNNLSTTDGFDAGAAADGGSGQPGLRTPGGLASRVQGGVIKVELLLDVDVIRPHPLAKKLGPLLGGIPQWREFMHGAETNIDPIRDTSWIHIYGPSFIHTGDDAVQVRYTATDETVDHAIELMGNNAADGGAYDVGVPGVRAFLGHADNADRVILRVRPHELVIVPPKKAVEFAKVLSEAAKRGKNIVPARAAGQAMLLVVHDPSKAHAIKGLPIPEGMRELRLKVSPNNDDGSADISGEGLCDTNLTATNAADDFNTTLAFARLAMPELPVLRFTTDGTRMVVEGHADRQQLERILRLAAKELQVKLPAD